MTSSRYKRLVPISVIAMASAISVVQAGAEEVFYDKARVISATPLFESITVPVTTEQCNHEKSGDEPAFESSVPDTDRDRSSGNTLVDAIRANPKRHPAKRPELRCQTITRNKLQEEIVAYKVRYEYGNEIYERRMDRDPGQFVRVRVRVDPRP